MSTIESWELASYIVTVVGLPFAILVFMYDQHRERESEEEEIYQKLSDEYADFLRLIIDNADLQLLSRTEPDQPFTPEQQERLRIVFDLLIALFERAYLLVYEDDMSRKQQRMWQSWEDYMRTWCRRPDFRALLPTLLEGEDADFASHIRAVAGEVAAR